jgi:hypothetical protein
MKKYLNVFLIICILSILLFVSHAVDYNERFCSMASSSGTHNGLDNTGFALTDCTWTAGTKTLTKTGAFASYTYAAGHYTYISSATAGTVGLYTVASRTSDNTIVLGTLIQGAGVASDQTDVATGTGPWTLAEAIAGAAAGDRVNCYGNYSAGAALAFSNANGTAALPIKYRGFVTTIGDLDSTTGNASTPTVTLSGAYAISFNGTFQKFSSMRFVSVKTTSPINTATNPQQFDRCRFTAGATGAAGAYAMTNGISGSSYTRCLFTSSTDATYVVTDGSYKGSYAGCVFTGGLQSTSGIAIYHSSASANLTLINNIFYGVGNGVSAAITSVDLVAYGNTFYDLDGDGIKTTATLTTGAYFIINNVFSNITGTAINQASGADIGTMIRHNNSFYSVGAQEAGMGPSVAVDSITETESPFTSTTSSNADFLKLKSTALSKAAGFPSGVFESLATQSYNDIGALQRVEPSGGTTTGVNMIGLLNNPIEPRLILRAYLMEKK